MLDNKYRLFWKTRIGNQYVCVWASRGGPLDSKGWRVNTVVADTMKQCKEFIENLASSKIYNTSTTQSQETLGILAGYRWIRDKHKFVCSLGRRACIQTDDPKRLRVYKKILPMYSREEKDEWGWNLFYDPD